MNTELSKEDKAAIKEYAEIRFGPDNAKLKEWSIHFAEWGIQYARSQDADRLIKARMLILRMQTYIFSTPQTDGLIQDVQNYLNEAIERPATQPQVFVQDKTKIINGPLGPTYATKLVNESQQVDSGEVEKLKRTVEMLTSGQPVTNADDAKLMHDLAAQVAILREALLVQSAYTKSWYSDEVREILGLFKQPYRGAGFPIKDKSQP